MKSDSHWSAQALTGQSREHIVAAPALRCELHRDILEPLLEMRNAALQDGIDLAVASAFRDFDRQCLIWNEKCLGLRPLLDASGQCIDLSALSDSETVAAILLWSALPGASRHHWGTEIDVFDRRTLPEPAQPQLLSTEFHSDGVFARLNEWLDAHAEGFGFYRPYVRDLGGVKPEPWHLSFAPLANQALASLTLPILRESLRGARLELAAEIEAALPEVYQHYVLNVTPASSLALSAPVLKRRPDSRFV